MEWHVPPCPRAQLDSLLLQAIHVPFPGREELHQILDLTTGSGEVAKQAVLDRATILEMQQLARKVPVARHVQDYAVRLIHGEPPAPRP